MQTNLSAAASVVDVADVFPSVQVFSSLVVEFNPSNKFNSVAVAVTPCNLLTCKVPVIELAARLRAISADSITNPPLAFKSTDMVLPDFCNPSAVVI